MEISQEDQASKSKSKSCEAVSLERERQTCERSQGEINLFRLFSPASQYFHISTGSKRHRRGRLHGLLTIRRRRA